jgi:uncharacterized phage-like protein YoqJ
MIVSVSGHRPDKLGGYGLDYRRLTDFARSQIISLKDKRTFELPSLILTGGAQGWDFACAFAAHQLEINYDVYIPFDGYTERWRDDKSLKQLEWIKAHAHQVVMTTNIPPEPGEPPNEFYRKRNNALVDNSDLLLALWNGNPETGTKMTIDRARWKRRPIVNCWPDYVKFMKSD